MQNIWIRKHGYQKIRLYYETIRAYLSIKSFTNYYMYKKICIESKISNIRIIENAIDETTNEIGISKDCYGKILVSTLEAVNNAILHGNEGNPEKNVEIEINFENDELVITVRDEGIGFKPELVPDPTVPENIESVNGRGVFLMSHLADIIKYNSKGNAVTMIFKNILA
jgi:serine/threonine-protein kinase RsbW